MQIQEKLVDSGIVAQFGMKGRGEKMALTNEDRIFVTGGEDFDFGAGSDNARGADEDHLEGLPFEFVVR